MYFVQTSIVRHSFKKGGREPPRDANSYAGLQRAETGMATSGLDFSFHDDQVLDGVARQVAANLINSNKRVERTATFEERLRLARELHDGVLQSLTGAVLQLEAISRLVDNDPQAARERLRQIQELIGEEQRELRTWIDGMRQAPSASMASHTEVAAALDKLCRRVSRWGPRVEFSGPDVGSVPRILGDQVYRIVEESLSNIARHAQAQVARVDVKLLPHGVRIVVEDDGCGFAFCGRYDLATLNDRRLGPVSLRERIGSLHGALVLTSTLSGSRLDIALPLQKQFVSRSSIANR